MVFSRRVRGGTPSTLVFLSLIVALVHLDSADAVQTRESLLSFLVRFVVTPLSRCVRSFGGGEFNGFGGGSLSDSGDEGLLVAASN